MTTFTINDKNEIVPFTSPEEAAANSATPFDTFSTADEMAQLARSWPAERLLTIWNCVGLTPATDIKDAAKAAKLIFKHLEKNGTTPAREKKPKTEEKARAGAQAAKDTPAKGNAPKKTPVAKPAPKGQKSTRAKEPKPTDSAPRDGTKMAAVIAMLKRKGGATITEIMEAMSWQRHTVRGFMAGAMKKAGHTVESFKPDGGERSYRLSK